MSFRFALESYLRLKQSAEHQQELLLAAACQRVSILEQQLAVLDDARSGLRRQQAELLRQSANVSELNFYQDRLGVLDRAGQSMLLELTAAREDRNLRHRALADARRQREVPEALRRRQLRSYNEREARRQQRQLDDLYLMLLISGRRKTPTHV